MTRPEEPRYDDLFMFSPNAHGTSRHARDFIEENRAQDPEWYKQFKSFVREVILAPDMSLGFKAHKYLEASCSDSPDDDTGISEAEQYFRDIWDIVAPGVAFPLNASIEGNDDDDREV